MALHGAPVRLTLMGTGDAFGSGGRLQTAFHLETPGHTLLIDCGPGVLIGLERAGLSAGGVDTIVISHLHGDHFAGLVFYLIHAIYVDKRTRRLTVAGPAGTEARLAAAMAALFPGAWERPREFAVVFQDLTAQEPARIAQPVGDGPPIDVTPFLASHPSGAPSLMLRLAIAGRTIAFTGDTEWVEALVPLAADADLLISECYAFDGPVRYHLSWEVLSRALPRLSARKIVLTHMNAGMLARADEIAGGRIVISHDGMVIDL